MGIDLTRHNFVWTLVLLLLLLLLFDQQEAMQGIVAAAGEIGTGVGSGHESGIGPLGVLLEQGASYISPWVVRGTKMVLMLWNGLLITQIVMHNRIILERTYLPAMVYIMLTGVGCPTLPSPAVLLAVSCTILAYAWMIHSFQRTVVFSYTFNAGCAIGMATLLYTPAIILIPTLFFGLGVFKKGARETIVTIVGMLLPPLSCSYIYWGVGYPFSYIPLQLKTAFWEEITQPHNTIDLLNPLLLAFFTLIVGITITAFVGFLKNQQKIRTRPYKAFLFFCWILGMSLVLVAVPGRNSNLFALVAVPLAVIAPSFFNRFSGRITNIVYLLLWAILLAYRLTV